MMKLFKTFLENYKDDSHEFLPIISEIEEEPINPLGRITFWIIVILIFFTALWLYFGKVDIVVTARGKIIPDGEIKIIQPFETGVVKNILVKEGQFVSKGQTLIEIDTSTTQPQLQSLKANLEYINTERQRLNGEIVKNAENSYTQNELSKSAYADLNNQLAAKNYEIRRLKEEANNYQKLLILNLDKERRMQEVSDIIAKNELDKVHSENLDYRSRIASLNEQIKGIQKEADYIRTNFRTQNLTQLADRDKQANELEANIKEIEFKKHQQNIISPVDGYINTMLIHTIGGIVTPAEKVISIVPINAPLTIKASVLDKDIGFVKKGMNVQIKVDTFDFQKYGMIEGVVKKVSKDSIEDEKQGLLYDVYITPVTKTLRVDGEEQPILIGMGLSAEIKTGKRRIIEFFIYPIIKYWSEAVSIK
jgi:secretion protein hlyD family protein